jgi:hypothetical protein
VSAALLRSVANPAYRHIARSQRRRSFEQLLQPAAGGVRGPRGGPAPASRVVVSNPLALAAGRRGAAGGAEVAEVAARSGGGGGGGALPVAGANGAGAPQTAVAASSWWRHSPADTFARVVGAGGARGWL